MKKYGLDGNSAPAVNTDSVIDRGKALMGKYGN
jgi:hypothetical protein